MAVSPTAEPNAAEPLLSVLVPALNEDKTIDDVMRALLAVPLDIEIILVDDGSSDHTWARMQSWANGQRIFAFRHPKPMGKGAAVRTALQRARGRFIIIQDADMEYDPGDYPRLLDPLTKGRARAVFGTRMFASHTAFSYWYVLGNRCVTLLANVLYNVYLSDMQTAYKVFPREAAAAMELDARGFEIDPEITAKLLRLGYQIHEVPVSYAARTRAEGKKVKAIDGVKALVTLMRFRLWRPTVAPARRLVGRPSPQIGDSMRADRPESRVGGHKQ
jgi:glycosyltransferase involved in cell wall biosynthesis